MSYASARGSSSSPSWFVAQDSPIAISLRNPTLPNHTRSNPAPFLSMAHTQVLLTKSQIESSPSSIRTQLSIAQPIASQPIHDPALFFPPLSPCPTRPFTLSRLRSLVPQPATNYTKI
ncbi:hypothetical protein CsSME_00035483 [Camellia sinensis var. sinensis]